MQLKRWADIERAAAWPDNPDELSDPVLMHVVQAVAAGIATREEALATVLLWLVDERRQWIRDDIHRLEMSAGRQFVLRPDGRVEPS